MKKTLIFVLVFIKILVYSNDNSIGKLPIIEALSPVTVKNDYFILLLSGDGGWKDIDIQLTKYFNEAGISVIGFNCFDYFSKQEKSMMEIANDVDRIINYYIKKLKKRDVVILGYSFGADLIPFIFNRLPESTITAIKKIILLGITKTAQFKIDLREFAGIKTNIKRYPTIPELNKIKNVPIFCICGDKDKTAACMLIEQTNTKIKTVPGGHHFNNDYKYISGLILEWIRNNN